MATVTNEQVGGDEEDTCEDSGPTYIYDYVCCEPRGVFHKAHFSLFLKGGLNKSDYHGNVSLQTALVRVSFQTQLHLGFKQCYNQSVRLKQAVLSKVPLYCCTMSLFAPHVKNLTHILTTHLRGTQPV